MSQSEKFQRQGLNRDQGYALVMVLALGMMMSLMGMGLILRSQQDVAIATGRKGSGKVGAIAEGAVARTLALLKQPQNAALLTRNYDPINPRTGRTYLGLDGALNSGDEGTTAVDEWTGFDPSPLPCYQQAGIGTPNIPLTGAIGGGNYTIRAYRYDETQQAGVVLVEGTDANQSNAIAVTFSLNPFLDNFPGIIVSRDPVGNSDLGLRNRIVQGTKGNIYFSPNNSADPSLSGVSFPGDATRASYLNAIYASMTQDGATADNIQGLISACEITVPPSSIPSGATLLPGITTSQNLSGTAGQITHYEIPWIDMGANETITVDTTAGPVYLWIVNNLIRLRGNAKIINVRTDGKPPKVGDLRITDSTVTGGLGVRLYDQSCIQDAFVYTTYGGISMLTTASGCPSGRNTNFEGFAWVRGIQTYKYDATNRDVPFVSAGFNTTIVPSSSGFYIPDDLTSMANTLQLIDWPARYQFGEIKSWKRQRL